MKQMTTFIFIDGNETDVNVEIYEDGTFKILDITVYCQHTGTPSYIPKLTDEQFKQVADKVELQHSALLTSGYFQPISYNGFGM